MDKLDKNIVLIGLPGCGKTTIGRSVSKRLNKDFVDMDKYIEEVENCTVTEIFSRGEQEFRRIETQAVESLSKLSGVVISTGGGVVKNTYNMEMLRKTSLVLFINRPVEKILSDIDVSIRPLLKSNVNELYKLFEERYPLYKKYCDKEIENEDELETVVEKIIYYINHEIL